MIQQDDRFLPPEPRGLLAGVPDETPIVLMDRDVPGFYVRVDVTSPALLRLFRTEEGQYIDDTHIDAEPGDVAVRAFVIEEK